MKAFSIKLVNILIICLLISIYGCETPSTNSENELTIHEENVASHYSSDKNILKIIGYNTIYSKDEDEILKLIELRKELEELAANRKHSEIHAVKNIYVNEDGSSYRLYFPMHSAIILDENGKTYYTDEKGLLKESISNIYNLKLIWRKKTKFIVGTANNIIEDDKII
ncbi:MAG: hypothetical protein LBE71_00330 [Dysgonamonadaceae bacterium]|jgi:hypothetical protein|nr:hypothetical protein [Dysgonamonadaceae bacterium]